MPQTPRPFISAPTSSAHLQSEIAQFEQARLRLLRSNQRDLVFALIGVVLVLTAYYLYWTSRTTAPLDTWISIKTTLLLLVLAFSTTKYFKNKRITSFQEKLKSKLITQLIKDINPALSYSAKGQVFTQEFIASGIFYTTPDHFHSEDSIKGQIDGIPFHLADVHAEQGAGDNKVETYFRGPFLMVRLPKFYQGETYILPYDYKEPFTKKISRKLWKGGRVGSKINFSSSPFSNTFRVISNNEQQAHSLLNQPFIDQLMTLPRKSFVSIIQDRLYVAVDNRRDLLEIDINRSFLKEGLIESYQEELKGLLGLVTTLNFNKHG
ncbi:MAG: DUF3137 domain-containing protein [Bacteroidota bacterium]